MIKKNIIDSNSQIVSLMQLQLTQARECKFDTAASALNEDEFVFRGRVRRQIDVGAENPNEPKYFAVSVWRVYRGCTFTNSTMIVVETPGTSGVCGDSFRLGVDLVFSGTGIAAEPKVIKKAQEKKSQNLCKRDGIHDFV